MNSPFKFLRRVRIHGGECGAVARALRHEVKGSSLYQADSGKSLGSTFIERKQMSTKTTFKRIALVAVAALGFGMLSVAPSSAAGMDDSTTNGGEVTSVSASVGSKALRVGVQSTIVVTFNGPAVTATNDSGTASAGGYTATTKVVNPNMKVLAVPSLATTTTVTSGTASADPVVGAVFVNDLSGAGTSSSAPDSIGIDSIAPALYGSAVYAGIKWTPSHAGTYSFLFWDDGNRDGALGGATEKYVIATFTVGNEIATLTASTTINNGTTIGTTYSAVVKVVAKDAAGNVTVPSGSDSVVLTATGSAKWKYTFGGASDSTTEVSGAGTSTAYLTSSDFNSSGAAYIGLYNNTAETVSITPSLIGSLTTPTVTTTTVKFQTPTTYIEDNTDVAVAPLDTVTTKDSASFYTVPVGSAAGLKITTAATTASAIAQLGIVESSGTTYGNAYIIGVTTVTTVATAVTTATAPYALGTLSYSSPSPSASAVRSYKLVVGGTATTLPAVDSLTTTTGGNSFTISSVLNNSVAAGITVSPSAPTLATGGTVNLQVTVVDSYDNARAGIAVTAAFNAGSRNSGKALASAITDADGIANFSYVDTNASAITTAMSDVIVFTTTSPLGATVSSTGTTISYVSGLTVSTVKMTTPNQTLGVASLAVVPKAIAFAAAGPTAGKQAVTATVTTSTGAVLSGLPVTWTVAGDGVAITSTTQTSYTSSTGVATAQVYAWKSGTYTITATSGGVSATGTITFTQEDPTSARTVSAASAGNLVTATVKDRFGNPVKGSTIYAKIDSGAGYFGNGALSTSGDTDANGQAKFVVAGGAATVTVSNISFSAVAGTQVGQTSAPKGYVVNATTNSATVGIFTASAAGTATTDETGVGASFDAAGVSSATVTVTGDTAIIDAANAANDAAAEAIDAANAATDAANLAAEAADAATVAAEEARDAADAATAAVEELATQVATLMAALKAQITTLANTVAKIAKKVKA